MGKKYKIDDIYEAISNNIQLKDNDKDLKISLFVEANEEVLRKCAEINCDAVEIHTGDYARAHLNGEDISAFITQYEKSQTLCKELGLGHHAGHGLTGQSVLPLIERDLFVEYNIGHWIICQAVYDGLSKVVQGLKESMTK